MEKIREYIKKEMEFYSSLKKQNLLENDIKNMKNKRDKKEDPNLKIKEEFNIWIENLNRSMYLRKYRQVLSEIETGKQNFESIPTEHWKYKIIQLKAIYHIIKIKITKYPLEMSKENSKQNKSVLFWFNYSFLILEQLILQFRDDINDNIDLKSKQILIPIQYIYLGHIQLIYLLIQYAYLNNQIPEICAYLSMVDRLANYSGFIVNIITLPLLQKIFLFRVKICLANCDYLNGMNYVKKTIDLCSDQLMYIIDFDLNIENLDKYVKDRRNPYNINKMNKKIFEEIITNIAMAFYLRGVLSELLGNVTKAIDSYKQSKFFSTKFLKNKFYNFTMFFNALQNNGYIYLSVMDEFKELKEQKELQKIIQNEYLRKKKYYDRIKYQRNYNKYYTSLRVKQNLYKGDLKKFLDSAGIILYKEELNRQSVLKKFTKTSYITSTMKMINNLLSKDFKNVLKKMDKVEVTKPSDEINSIINRTLIRKRQILFNKKNNSKNKNKENIFNKKTQSSNNTIADIRNKTNNINKNIKSNNNNSMNNVINNIESLNNIKCYKIKQRPLSESHLNKKNNIYYNRLNDSNIKKTKSRNESNSNIKRINNKVNKSKSEFSSLETFDNDYSNKRHFLLDNNSTSLSKNSYLIKSSSSIFLKQQKNKNKNKINKSYFNNKSNNKKIPSIYNCKRNSIDKNFPKNKKYKLKIKNEYRIDKDNFGKDYLEKKLFLDKYCNEEIKFHINLLKSKSCELELTKEPTEYDSKRMRREAERTFDKIFELCKSSTSKKNISNLLKHKIIGNTNISNNANINMSTYGEINRKKIFNFYDEFKEDEKEDKIIDAKEKKYILLNNEEKMKILNMEYEQMVQKEKDIKNKKKNLFNEIMKK